MSPEGMYARGASQRQRKAAPQPLS